MPTRKKSARPRSTARSASSTSRRTDALRPILTGLLILALFAGDLWLLLTHPGHEVDLTTYSIIHDTYRAPWLTRAMEIGTEIGQTKSAAIALALFGFWGT